MSYKPPVYGPKGQEQNWINSIVQTHDCWCGCDDPLLHLFTSAIKKGGIYNFNTESAKKLLCPPYYYRRWQRRPFQYRWRRRLRYRSRRPRKTLRRRWRTYRRRNWVRKRKFKLIKKKKKYLILKEYQPKNIKKCTIKGFMTLFQSGPNRLQRENSTNL